MIPALVVAGILIVIVLVVRSKRFRSRIRMWERGPNFIRLFPNPGFKIGGCHWCRHYGRKAH